MEKGWEVMRGHIHHKHMQAPHYTNTILVPYRNTQTARHIHVCARVCGNIKT